MVEGFGQEGAFAQRRSSHPTGNIPHRYSTQLCQNLRKPRLSTGTIVAIHTVDWTRGTHRRTSGLTTQSQPHDEPLGSKFRRRRVNGQPQAPTARQRGCPFLHPDRSRHEPPYRASCSVDVRMGPLRRGRRTTHADGLTRRRCLLGLSQSGGIARHTNGHQRRVRDLPGMDPRCATHRVTVHSVPPDATAVSRAVRRLEW